MKNLEKYCKKNEIQRIALPKMQGGLEKLDWKETKKMINRIMLSKGIECHVYTGKENLFISSVSEENLQIEEKLKKLQLKDEIVKEMINICKSGKLKGFIIEGGVLMKIRKGKNRKIYRQIVIPESLKKDVYELCHDNFTGAHLGEKKTCVKLSNRFY